MIDETLLTRALDDAATAYDEPPGARDAILAAIQGRAAAEPTARRRPVWRRPLPVGALASLVLLLGVAAAMRFGNGGGTLERVSGPVSAGKGGTAVPAAPDACPGCVISYDGGGSGAGSVSGGTADTDSAPAPQRPAPAPMPAAGQAQGQAQAAGSLAKVVKTGSVEIAVADGAVAATLTRLETLVAGTRGFVAQSKTQESGDTPSGVVTMRVPSTSYEPVLTQVRRLGEVRAATSAGQDVTAEFVDNEARLRTLRQTLTVYETLLARARSIGEVLAVQQQVNAAQTQIEQIEGRLKVLNDQVGYATLTVTVVEESDETALVPADRSRLRQAWDDAKDNFADGLAWLVAASGTLAILIVCGAVLLGLWLAVRRTLRRRLV